LVLLVFGMTVNSPVPVRVTALALGPITIVAGLLLPRVQGSLELSATGFKGQIDSVPAALVLAQRAAEIAIPEDEPNRDERASDAAWQALKERLHVETDAAMAQERRISAIYSRVADDLARSRRSGGSFSHKTTISPISDVDIITRPTDEPPPAKPS
jgi:hypothetical protein